MSHHIQRRQPGLFDNSDRLEELTAMGDPLARLDEVVEWDVFAPVLAGMPREEARGPGGRPAYEPMLLFKVLVIQSLYNLSDAQIEFQITDRLSFKRFLGFSAADKAPDEKTVWAFRDKLARFGLVDKLFAAFHRELERRGLFARKGQMVDATFVEVPRQRNSREENAAIKEGRTPEGWEDDPEMLRQKDLDARWTKKNEVNHYGYKNHVKVDSRSKLIESYAVTDAAVHDSQALDALIREGDPKTYADSAYVGPECAGVFAAKNVEAKVIERAYRNKPLTARQRKRNRTKSKVRVRVEHVFATMRMSMRRTWNRCIGRIRNGAAIGMTNRVYNMVRFEQIERLDLCKW
jgi:IS5 family transposase